MCPIYPEVTRWVVLPLSSLLPRFPPVPSFSFQAPDGVRIVSDAGSIISTVQLVYRQSPDDKVSNPGPGQELRKVFDLDAYDHRAKPISLDLRRPWILEVPIRGLTKTFEDPARLLIARHEEDRGWVPLVTNYHQNRGVLQARVLKVGRFAVLAEPLPQAHIGLRLTWRTSSPLEQAFYLTGPLTTPWEGCCWAAPGLGYSGTRRY